MLERAGNTLTLPPSTPADRNTIYVIVQSLIETTITDIKTLKLYQSVAPTAYVDVPKF